MQEHVLKVDFPNNNLFEIVGTGGSQTNYFNISTTSAIVVASSGMKVAKHGNRAASSQCGSADCLKSLGVNIQQSPNMCLELLNQVSFCYFFVQKYHSAMKFFGTIRKEPDFGLFSTF